MLIFLPYMELYSKNSKKFHRKFTKMKVKCLEKIGSAWFVYKKWQVISTIYMLIECNFRWNCEEFYYTMDLTIRMTIFNKEACNRNR